MSAVRNVAREKLTAAQAELTAAKSNLAQAAVYQQRYASLKSRGYAAIADYDRAIALNPRYEDAFVNRGAARAAKGDAEPLRILPALRAGLAAIPQAPIPAQIEFNSDQIMLVTDKGQLIRCPVEGIRIAGRSTQGVIVFDTAEDEHVVSVEHIGEEAENGNGNGNGHASGE